MWFSSATFSELITSLLPKQEVEAYFSCYTTPLSKTIMLLSHKAKAEDILHTLQQKKWKTIHSQYKNHSTYTLENTDSSPGQHFLHQWWFFYVQEFAASLPAYILTEDIKENDIILDLCSAPGWKTIQLADHILATKKWGMVIANEPGETRRKALVFNINRTGCYNTVITWHQGEKIWEDFPESVNHVLVDAPCSWEGMAYKTGEITSRDEKKSKSLARTQYTILSSAIHACKVGGTIIYSTCTLNPREDEMVIANILKEFWTHISLENIALEGKSEGIATRKNEEILSKEDAKKLVRCWPHLHHTGWFFIAKLKKQQTTKTMIKKEKKKEERRKPMFDSSKKLQIKVKEILAHDFWIEIDETMLFVWTKNKIYLTNIWWEQIWEQLPIDKIGIPIYDIGHSWNRIPTHHLGNILGHLATKNTYILSDDEADTYSKNEDIVIENITWLEDWFIILKRKNYWFSIGKITGNVVKNKCI